MNALDKDEPKLVHQPHQQIDMKLSVVLMG